MDEEFILERTWIQRDDGLPAHQRECEFSPEPLLNSTDIDLKYTKSHAHINPKAITPMGPIPDIESGVEKDWNKMKAGGVKLSA